jgi:hypothetical protein
VGYLYDFARTGPVKWSVGGLVSTFRTPADLDPYYGSQPRAYMVFLQARI